MECQGRIFILQVVYDVPSLRNNRFSMPKALVIKILLKIGTMKVAATSAKNRQLFHEFEVWK